MKHEINGINCTVTTSLKYQLRKLFFQNSVNDSHSDSAILGETLKRLQKKTDKHDTINQLNNKTDPLQTGTELNTLFTDMGPQLASKIGPSNLDWNIDRK